MTEIPPRGLALGTVGLVVAGLVCQEVGAAVAVTVFPQVGSTGMVALRLFFSAVVLMIVFRPRLRGRTRVDWFTVVAFGLVLAIMNTLFYAALTYLPLGVTLTFEILGPLILSVVISRRASSWLWALLAFGGVALLARGGFSELHPVGVLLALGAGAMWVGYILLAGRTGQHFSRLDGLAIAMSIGAIVTVPFGVATAGAPLFRPEVLLLGFAVALLSSAVPYGLELLALRRMAASTFSILLSLAPGLAAVAGFFILGQTLELADAAAIALVVVASMGAVRAASRSHPSEPLDPLA